MADFREAGADLPSEQKQRAAELQSKLAERTQKYSENCLDATNAWGENRHGRKLARRPARVRHRRRPPRRGAQGARRCWRFTLQAPSYIPVMTYADSDTLREEVWRAYAAIGRGESQNNQELVREILELRHEFAQLVGKANFADHVTERRMAASGDAALEFGDAIFQKVRDQFEAEAQALRDFKGQRNSCPLPTPHS